MTDDQIKLVVSELGVLLSTLPEEVRQGLTSSEYRERWHARLQLRRSHVGAKVAGVLASCGVLPHPPLLRVFVNSATSLDPGSIAYWLVERAVAVGASTAVADLAAFSTASTFVAREIMVVDGLRVRESFELAAGVYLRPLAALQPTCFRDQLSESAPWGPSAERRAALVKTFEHPVIFMRANDPFPPYVLEITRDPTLRDVARLFTLFREAAPVAVARWWEHDFAIPGGEPTTGADTRGGLEASFLPFEVSEAAAQSLREWISRLQACPHQWLRIALDRLNAAKRRGSRVDQAIELGVAAEALFLRCKGEDRSELSFRLATRAAWLLGSSRAEREQVFDVFHALYDARSYAVHRGEVPSKVKGRDVVEVLLRGCELLERAIIATLEEPERDLRRIHLG